MKRNLSLGMKISSKVKLKISQWRLETRLKSLLSQKINELNHKKISLVSYMLLFIKLLFYFYLIQEIDTFLEQ